MANVPFEIVTAIDIADVGNVPYRFYNVREQTGGLQLVSDRETMPFRIGRLRDFGYCATRSPRPREK